MKTIGIDVANSTLKIYSENMQVMYRNTVKKLNDNEIIFSFKPQNEFYEYQDMKYELGKLSETGSGGRHINRYLGEDFKLESLFAIAKTIGNEPESVKVVTGIPCSKIKDKETLDAIKNTLIGHHMVKIYDTNANCKTKVFNIAEVFVVPQPIGTLYNSLYDDKGKIVSSMLLEKKCLVIDIGWSTLDLAILEDGCVRQAFGFDIGTSDYIFQVQEDLNKLYPEAFIYSLNQHELDHMLLSNQNVETAFGIFDASNVCQKNRKDQAKKIYQKIMTLGLNLNEFYKIILTGGGSKLYETDLKLLFNDPRITVQENPQISNAKGFYMIGKYQGE